MSESDSERDPIDRLAEEFVDRYRRGERPALTEYAERFPELADEIRDLFPALIVMEGVAPDPGADSDSAPEMRAGDGRTPARIGEYRILRVIGRGGMGVVYEAEQEALGRHVALKVLPNQAISDGRRLLRFQREARTAAQLHHTNIVPVFGVGEADGLHYYVMQFIRGLAFDQVLVELQKIGRPSSNATLTLDAAGGIGSAARSLLTGVYESAPTPHSDAPTPAKVGVTADRSTSDPVHLPGGEDASAASGSGREYWRSIARVGVQVADALAYAHHQGVLHRDIKPSNLLLDAHGTVWVTDFGLAKTADSDDLTQAGDVIGTLRYMPPERFDGQSTAQGDIYSLGVTLYELATFRPAFDETDRGRLIRQVTTSNPVRPRKVNPAIPHDLETVILKSMACDPGHRYQSASTLADDLRRFLEGRSVLARRASRTEKLWRWAKRNPAVASLLGLVLSLLTVLSVGGAAFSFRLSAALKQSLNDQRQAEKDRDQAREARREGQAKLFQSLVSDARSQRHSQRIGQRFGTLKSIREAVQLAKELDKPAEMFDELRNLASAALALPDLQPAPDWISDPDEPGWVPHARNTSLTSRLHAVDNFRDQISIRRVGESANDTGEVARVPSAGADEELTWSRDGRHLAAWGFADRRLKVWRMDGDKPVPVVEEKSGTMAYGFTPDGSQLITVGQGSLRVYDLPSGRVRSLPGIDGLGHAAVHPTRTWVALSTRPGVSIIDLKTGQTVHRLNAEGFVYPAWHPDGELLAVACADRIEVWDVPRGRRNWVGEHRGGGLEVAFNETGDILSSWGWAWRLKLWNPHTGREVFRTPGGARGFGPDDRMLMGFPDRWSDHRGPLTKVEPAREYRTLVAGVELGGAKDYVGCSLHPNGRLLAVGTNTGWSLLDLETGTEQAFLPGMTPVVQFEPDGSLLTSGSTGLLRWPVRIETHAPHRILVGPPERIPVPVSVAYNIAQSADGQVLARANLSGAYVWRRDRPRDAIHLTPHIDCRYVSVSPDGQLVATGSHSGGEIKVWNARDGRLVRVLPIEKYGTVPQFSPDGKLLFNQYGENWRVDDWSPGPRHAVAAGRISFTPDMRLAGWSGHPGFVVLVDPVSGRELARLEDPHQDTLGIVTFNAEGTLLIGTTNDSFCVRVWDLRKIREGLKDLDLDWEAPPSPPAPATTRREPLHVEWVGSELANDSQELEKSATERLLIRLWMNPFDPDAHLEMAVKLYLARKDRDAIPHLTVAIAFRPDSPAAYRLRANAWFGLGNWKQAVADATLALARSPKNSGARYTRAIASARLGQHESAVVDLTELIGQYPGDAELYRQRAASYEALGEPAKAKADRATALRLPGVNPVLLNDEAWRLVTGPPDTRDPKRALELITRAFQQQPNEPTFWNTLGVVQYRNALYVEAIQSLDKSLNVGQGESDAYDLYFLAMCHAKRGNHNQSITCFDRAVAWHEKKKGELTPINQAELKQFRAEATETLQATGVIPELIPPPRLQP